MDKHCDDYIDDDTQPACLRAFLSHARAPAIQRGGKPAPPLFAKHSGQIVRVVMASRFGDVGVSFDLERDHGYDKRMMLSELTDFSASMSAHQYESPNDAPQATAKT